MAKQVKNKKVKVNPTKVNRREMIHMDYMNVYNEVLKFEEVVDVDIDHILSCTKDVLAEELSLSKLASSPSSEELETLADKILDRVKTTIPASGQLFEANGTEDYNWDY